jgi:hypothetical protein
VPQRVAAEMPQPVAPTRVAEPRPERAPARPSPMRDSGPFPVSEPDAGDSVELERPRMGMFGIIVLVMLVLLALVVTALSVVQKGTPDPRPLLEDVYRQVRG